jgi:hypothetical protein
MSEESNSLDFGNGDSSGWIGSNRIEGDNGYWETPIVRDEDGEPIGASFFLTEDDLDVLGIEVESVSEIGYRITAGGRIELSNIENNEQMCDSVGENYTLVYVVCHDCDEIEKMRVLEASQDSEQVQRVTDTYYTVIEEHAEETGHNAQLGITEGSETDLVDTARAIASYLM